MGNLLNFKIPKIDKSILPSISDLGFDGSSINSKINELKDKLNVDGINIPSIPDIKSGAGNILKSLPTIGNFSAMSLIPSDMTNMMDTNKIMNDINNQLSSIDLGDATLKLPDDVGVMAKDIVSGNGIDFASLYTMPPIKVESPSNVGSEFDINEFSSEISAFESAVNGSFDIEKYIKDFDNINI